MDQYAGSDSPGRGTCCYAELTVSFVNFLYYCEPSSGFYGAGKDNRGRRTDSTSGRHPIWTSGAPTSIIPPFLRRMPFRPVYPGLGQAPNNAGFRTQLLGYPT